MSELDQGSPRKTLLYPEARPASPSSLWRKAGLSVTALSLWDTDLMEIAATVNLVTLHKAPDSTGANSLTFPS